LLRYMLGEASFEMIEAAYKSRIPYLRRTFLTKHESLLIFGDTIVFVARAVTPNLSRTT